TNADTVAVIAARLRCYAIRMAAIPNTINRDGKGRYGACMFVLFGPRPENSLPHNCIRSITAANDGGKWVFDTYGLPLPFENAGQYLLKRVRDKFTFEMLEEYLAAMSLFPFDESFYLPPGNERAILATTSAKFRPDARDISLEEARAGY
ncbi:MAG: hypothetical protein KDE04_19005, partial [Anaerolineales bacterium]|nr:hypothetical protein [Anaerolineales bacterium]